MAVLLYSSTATSSARSSLSPCSISLNRMQLGGIFHLDLSAVRARLRLQSEVSTSMTKGCVRRDKDWGRGLEFIQPTERRFSFLRALVQD